MSRKWLATLALVCLVRTASAEPRAPETLGGRTLSARLENGLEVVLSEAREQPIFSAAVRYGVGSKNDPKDLHELSHLVEHLSFSAPHGGRDALRFFNSLGVTYNAVTEDDDTTYVSTGPIAALSQVLWLERERMAFALSSLSAANVVSERRTLANEDSSMRADRVGGMALRFVRAELYPPEHPYAPAKEGGCVQRCELRHAQWLMQRGYRPDNARLIVVGDFDAQRLLPQITGLFGSVVNSGVRLPTLASTAPRSGHRSITVAVPAPRSSVELFWHVPEPLRKKSAQLSVLSQLVRRLLAVDLKGTNALASRVSVRLIELELDWVWETQIELLPGVDPRRVEQRALAVLERVKQQALPVELARRTALTRLLERWDDPDERAFELTRADGFGFELGRAKRELSAVSADDVSLAARQFLTAAPALSVHLTRAVDAAREGELYRAPE